MRCLLTTIDEGVANNLTQSNEKCCLTKSKSEKQKTKANRKKGTLPSKYGGNGAPWYVLHEDVHYAPI